MYCCRQTHRIWSVSAATHWHRQSRPTSVRSRKLTDKKCVSRVGRDGVPAESPHPSFSVRSPKSPMISPWTYVCTLFSDSSNLPCRVSSLGRDGGFQFGNSFPSGSRPNYRGYPGRQAGRFSAIAAAHPPKIPFPG